MKGRSPKAVAVRTIAEERGCDVTPFFNTEKYARERMEAGKPPQDTPGYQILVDKGEAPPMPWSRRPRDPRVVHDASLASLAVGAPRAPSPAVSAAAGAATNARVLEPAKARPARVPAVAPPPKALPPVPEEPAADSSEE